MGIIGFLALFVLLVGATALAVWWFDRRLRRQQRLARKRKRRRWK